MLRTFKNASSERRVWTSLSDPTGHTVELAPGDKVDLDLPADFNDPHLVLVTPVARMMKREETPTKEIDL